MEHEAEWQRMIDGLRRGDEDVLAEFCDRYATALARVAEHNIAPALRRRFGGETVAQSACCSFLMRAREGRFEIPDSESLWRLLCAITLRKVREKVRFHSRRRRAVQQEDDAGGSVDEPLVERLADRGLGPGEALAIAEEFQDLLDGLDEEERRIVELKLQERSNAEIARELGCSERTVRRLSLGLRERLESLFEAA
jgi:RNA polymerase sigma factor (sigma-70 family)